MSKPVFTDQFTLSGRRNRLSYALFMLYMTAFLVFAMTVASYADSSGAWLFATVAGLVTAATGCTLGAQRCRDFGWSGWSVLLCFVPLIGWVFALALLVVPGTAGPNRFGPDPLAEGEGERTAAAA
jgi:uncharacterized membrane protein YhaH (DUF805 family)